MLTVHPVQVGRYICLASGIADFFPRIRVKLRWPGAEWESVTTGRQRV